MAISLQQKLKMAYNKLKLKGFIMGMIDWMTSNPETLKGLGSLLSAGGSIYGGIMQQQNANALINLQKQGFDLQKRLTLEDEQKRKKSAEAFNNAFANYGQQTPLIDLGGVS